MSSSRIERGWTSVAVTLVVFGVLAGIGAAGVVDRGAAPREGRAEKRGSGRSYLHRTVVEPAPSLAKAGGFDGERAWSGQDDWEPAIAADPFTSDVYQMTTRYTGPKPCNGCPLPAVVFRRSRDGGATWDADRFMPPTKSPQYDPQVEVSSSGAVYVAWIDDFTPGIRFTRSTDRGATWSTPLSLTPRKGTPNWSDKPLLAISRDGRDVYLAFNASDSWVAASHDFGATFGANVKTSNDARYWFHTAGAVAPDGSVYFATSDFTQDYTGDANVQVIKSTNGGVSWTTHLVDVSRELPPCPWAAGCYFGFFGSIVGLAVDVQGTVAIVYTATTTPGGPTQLFFKKSTDGGNTWSARFALSGAPAGTMHHSPAIAAGPTAGDFRVLWQDDRNGTHTAWNAWYRSTTNGGNSWTTPVRVSNLGSGAPYKSAAGYSFPYGDYDELTVDAAGVSQLIWGEGSSFTGPGGTWYTRGN
jgi:hypothetical protein